MEEKRSTEFINSSYPFFDPFFSFLYDVYPQYPAPVTRVALRNATPGDSTTSEGEMKNIINQKSTIQNIFSYFILLNFYLNNNLFKLGGLNDS